MDEVRSFEDLNNFISNYKEPSYDQERDLEEIYGGLSLPSDRKKFIAGLTALLVVVVGSAALIIKKILKKNDTTKPEHDKKSVTPATQTGQEQVDDNNDEESLLSVAPTRKSMAAQAQPAPQGTVGGISIDYLYVIILCLIVIVLVLMLLNPVDKFFNMGSGQYKLVR